MCAHEKYMVYSLGRPNNLTRYIGNPSEGIERKLLPMTPKKTGRPLDIWK